MVWLPSVGSSWHGANLFASLLLATASCASPLPLNETLTVSIPSYGSFTGTTLNSTISGYPLSKPVHAWYGIDYATQPIGDLRFSVTGWPPAFNGTRNAKVYGKVCIQEPGNSNLVTYIKTDLEYGEDCLNLNVFRPAGVSIEEKLPVLIWIHGVRSR